MLVSCHCKLLGKAALQGKCWSKLYLEKNSAASECDWNRFAFQQPFMREGCAAKLRVFDVAVGYITLQGLLLGESYNSLSQWFASELICLMDMEVRRF